MARRSLFDRVRDLFRPKPAPTPPPPPVAPLPTRPSRNQAPLPRQAPKPVPSRPSRTFSARTLQNYKGWRQVRVVSNALGDAVNFIRSLPPNYLVIVVAEGQLGDYYNEGEEEYGWITVQSKMYAGEVDNRGRINHRLYEWSKLSRVDTLHVRYGAVRTLGDQER